MERSQSIGKLSAMAKAKTAFQSLHQKAEKLLNEVKAEIRGHESSSSTPQVSPNGAPKSPQQLPWTAKNAHEKKHEEEFKRRILGIAQQPDEYFFGPCEGLVDMRAAMAWAGAVLEVDDTLRTLRYKLVPKKLSDQEFWKRYTLAVKRIRQEVLDASASEDAASESSLTDSVIISRQESGLEALVGGAKEDLQETPVFLPLPIPPSTTVRRLSRAVEVSRACASMQELTSYEGHTRDPNGDNSDTWSTLVSGLQGFATKTKSKNRANNMGGAAEYHALLWTLFEADATAEDLAASSEAGILDRPHTLAEDLQGAPSDSFVAQLAEVMAGIKTEQKMAAFWMEVVKQLRKHWAERRPIPRTPIDAQPELYFCNLQQQLELLNCCISRWKRRVAALEAAKAAATAAAAEAEALTSAYPQLEHFDDVTERKSNGSTSSTARSARESMSYPQLELFSALEEKMVSEEKPVSEEKTAFEDKTAFEEKASEQASGTERKIASREAVTSESKDENGHTKKQFKASTSNGNGISKEGQQSVTEAQKRFSREGVECAVPGMRLLATGEQMYAPVTQEGPILTEDLIKETEELVLKTGSVGHGCKQLLSDMQAFKAANPGCKLEDFVRWYSPPDFIQGTPPSKSRPGRMGGPETPQPEGGVRSEEAPSTPSTSTAFDSPPPKSSPFTPTRLSARKHFQKGALSARMRSEGNLWQELWTSALPIPAIRQAPLFDEDLAGETALDELANISPSDLFEQLFVVALGAGFAVAQSSPQADREPLKSCLEKCAAYAIETCGRHMSPAKLERLCQVYETMEHAALLPPDEDLPSPTLTEAVAKEGEAQMESAASETVETATAIGDPETEALKEAEPKKVTVGEDATAALSEQVGRSRKESEDGWTVL